MQQVQTGLDAAVVDGFGFQHGARVGVLANQASRDSQGRHLVELLENSANGGRLVKLFAPEHGFTGNAQDMIPVGDCQDAETGLEIISLYGDNPESLRPASGDLEGLDILVVDLPDIGARYYTYSQTLAYCMEAAGKAGVQVVVLDRPNPIGGGQFEGSPLGRGYRSFCGIGPIANRHGFTLGELAKLFHGGFGEGTDALEPVACDLDILPARGWRRSQYLDDTGLPWFPPSPNIPGLETVIVYPGMCLFEATNLSEGRGTDKPFLQVGAPYIDPDKWKTGFHDLGWPLEGFSLSPAAFTPAFQKHAGHLCRGLSIRVTDRGRFQPYRLGIALILSAAKAFSEQFAWRKEAYEFIADVPAIDLLYGGPTLRQVAQGQATLTHLMDELENFETWYRDIRTNYLIY